MADYTERSLQLAAELRKRALRNLGRTEGRVGDAENSRTADRRGGQFDKKRGRGA